MSEIIEKLEKANGDWMAACMRPDGEVDLDQAGLRDCAYNHGALFKEAADELTRLRSQPTSEEVQQAVMFARKHVKSRTAGDGAYGEGEDCVALDLLGQLADLIESLARSEAALAERCDALSADAESELKEAYAELAAHKADAEQEKG